MDSIFEMLLLVGIGFFAGAINTVAGGGSLLTLPVLIFLGLSPTVANGTNRIAILFQSVFTTVGYKSKGIQITLFSIYLGLAALLGAVIGVQIAVDIKGETFNKVLAVVMLLVVAYMLSGFKAKATELVERTSGKHLWLSVILFFFVGIYGGFIQAGVGFIMLVILTAVNQMSLVKANAVKVIVVLIYTLLAVYLFWINNALDWKYGLLLAFGNSIGGWLTSRWSVKKGDRVVRKIVVIMIVVMAIKLWFF